MRRQDTIRTATSQHTYYRWVLAVSALLTISSLCRVAWSESGQAGEPSRFHLRFGVGVVATAQAIDKDNAPISFSTAPGILDGVQIGGRLTETLALFFEADSLVMFQNTNPKPKADDGVMYGFLTGLGVGYRVLPANIYLSGAVGATLSDVIVGSDVDPIETARVGLGFSAMIGKDWWASDGLSLGLSGQFLYMATVQDQASGFTKHTVALGMLLTASFV